MQDISFRLETAEDFREVEELTREAFWNNFQQGCDEHYILHKMRNHKDYIHELSYLAISEGKIVGSIVYSKSIVKRFDGSVENTITFGPISVHPDYQRKGIGKALISYSAKMARDMGYNAVVIYGDPSIYGRFGFHCGEKYDLRTSDNHYAIALQVLLLQEVELCGCFEESSIFREIDPLEVENFDATFPPKEKLFKDSQNRFNVLLSLSFPAVKFEI